MIPNNFRWGITASSVSAEGVSPQADWSSWESRGKAPRSESGAGFANEYTNDLGLAANIGLTDFRLTLEWARIEPKPGVIDLGVIDHYREILTTAKTVGLSSWATMHSTSLPGWFSKDERGFQDSTSRSRYWARHVDRTAEQFEDLVSGWAPIEDPIGWALRGFLLGTRPPGHTRVELTREAIKGIVEATFEAWRLLGSGRQPVMAVLGLPSVMPIDEGARPAARLWESVLWDTWLKALGDGEFVLPWETPVERPEIEGLVDIIGIVADHPIGINSQGEFRRYPSQGRIDGSGFCPLPEELGMTIRRVNNSLPAQDLVVASTGVATDDDDWRDELLNATINQVEWAITDGIPLRGLFYDSWIDGYEWNRGFETPRGLLTRERQLKPSGHNFSHRIAQYYENETFS